MNHIDIKSAGLKDIVDILIHTKHPRFAINPYNRKGLNFCYACGHQDGFQFVNIIDDNLANEWRLNSKLRRAFDTKESTRCRHCNTSLRSNLQARSICRVVAPESRCLDEAVKLKTVNSLKIAEINSCGALHQFLSKMPNLLYSEYNPLSEGIRHEDLHNLSYKTASLDIVLTSETLEHVPDWQRAKKEIHRVLKSGGKHIFTVPAILNRETRTRSVQKDNKEIKLLPDSFHGCTQGIKTSDYIVRTEYGADFRRLIDELGFTTKLYYRNILHLYDPSFVFVSTKV